MSRNATPEPVPSDANAVPPKSDIVKKAQKLEHVCYDIRGPALIQARRLEEEGFKVIKLNSGNVGLFNFDAPDELIQDIIKNIRQAQPYVDSKGMFSARKAVMQHFQNYGVLDLDIDDIYIGNGVSELIGISMSGLLNDGDEVLIPTPDYPLWTASVTMAGGKAVHYVCDESSGWLPDLADIRRKISSRTRGILIINPNNPTGAVYPRELLEEIHKIAAEHRLVVYADEIYEKILYDGAVHHNMASICRDVLCVSFGGLSKVYRAAGFRVGWMVLSGRKGLAKSYREGLDMLSNMRMCANALGQLAVQAALGGYQSINDLTAPGGRLHEQMNVAYEGLSSIPGVSCIKPKGALYLFPKLDHAKFGIKDDQKLILDLLMEKKILVTQGTGFNYHKPDHFRFIFLPDKETLRDVCARMADFFSWYRQ
jgi:alanine-synthesizing transaminase